MSVGTFITENGVQKQLIGVYAGISGSVRALTKQATMHVESKYINGKGHISHEFKFDPNAIFVLVLIDRFGSATPPTFDTIDALEDYALSINDLPPKHMLTTGYYMDIEIDVSAGKAVVSKGSSTSSNTRLSTTIYWL